MLFVILTGIALMLVVRIYIQYQEDQEIKKYEGITKATIIKFEHINLTAYYIDYKYYVEGKKYIGSTGVERFRCDNGKWGCLGEKFKVSYSKKKPSKSTIHLGKYEKYKRTVEF